MWSANALFVNYKTVHSWDRGREKKENTLSFSPNSKTQKQSTFEKEKERSALHCCSINTTTFGDCSRFRYASLRGGHQKRREEEMIRRESFEGKTPEKGRMAPQRRDEAEGGGRADPRPKMMDADTFMLMVVVVIVFLVGFWCRPFLFLFLFLSPDSPH